MFVHEHNRVGFSCPPAETRVILIDDGLATGSTMRAAVTAPRQQGPAEIVVAVPVGAASTCAQFRDDADQVVCAITPETYPIGI